MDIANEAKRRRTFGIISHPDAGKTTLTEKLSSILGRFIWQDPSSLEKPKIMLYPTGWKWKSNVGFLSPPLYYSLSI